MTRASDPPVSNEAAPIASKATEAREINTSAPDSTAASAASPFGQVLATFARSRRGKPEEIRIVVSQWRCWLIVHARRYQPAEGGGMAPTAYGVTFRPEDLPILAAAVAEAQKIAAAMGEAGGSS